MSKVRDTALETLMSVQRYLDGDEYLNLFNGIIEIEPLKERDARIEELWYCFEDIPVNPETECIEEGFLHWPIDTNREEIWHWFDERHSKGVHYLLYELK